MQKQKTALITGVSSGIGLAATRSLIKRGWRVYGSVRKQADSDQVQAELGAHFIPLIKGLKRGAKGAKGLI